MSNTPHVLQPQPEDRHEVVYNVARRNREYQENKNWQTIGYGFLSAEEATRWCIEIEKGYRHHFPNKSGEYLLIREERKTEYIPAITYQ